MTPGSPLSSYLCPLVFGDREYQIAVSELKKAIQILDKAKGGAMIIENENVLTVYKC